MSCCGPRADRPTVACMGGVINIEKGMMTIYRRAMLAYMAGRDAAVAGRPHRNPHNGNAETTVERVLSIMWARGYSAGNPMPRHLGSD